MLAHRMLDISAAALDQMQCASPLNACSRRSLADLIPFGWRGQVREFS